MDTDTLSAVADGEPGALREFARARRIAIPVIVLGEYRFAIALSRRRNEYERWLAGALAASYAEVRLELRRAGAPIPTNDIWIAALCRQHSLSILSRDEHFDLVDGVKRIGW